MTLKAIRENAGMTVQEVAAAANVSTAFVYKAEEGREKVSRVYVARICKALGVNINQVEGLNLR